MGGGSTIRSRPKILNFFRRKNLQGSVRLTLPQKAGFTLIELSIVLVIIGFLVGGVLVGQTLLTAAAVRAQATQIEKYNAAVNTFYGKFQYLPGDMPQAAVQQWGFTVATSRLGWEPLADSTVGRGNGDGILEGSCYCANGSAGLTQGAETYWFLGRFIS